MEVVVAAGQSKVSEAKDWRARNLEIGWSLFHSSTPFSFFLGLLNLNRIQEVNASLIVRNHRQGPRRTPIRSIVHVSAYAVVLLGDIPRYLSALWQFSEAKLAHLTYEYSYQRENGLCKVVKHVEKIQVLDLYLNKALSRCWTYIAHVYTYGVDINHSGRNLMISTFGADNCSCLATTKYPMIRLYKTFTSSFAL